MCLNASPWEYRGVDIFDAPAVPLDRQSVAGSLEILQLEHSDSKALWGDGNNPNRRIANSPANRQDEVKIDWAHLPEVDWKLKIFAPKEDKAIASTAERLAVASLLQIGESSAQGESSLFL